MEWILKLRYTLWGPFTVVLIAATGLLLTLRTRGVQFWCVGQLLRPSSTRRQDGITPRPMIYAVLDVVVNLTRSFPFLILMIAVIPLTRLLVGTTIGNNATVVPLVIAAAPFVARLVESSLLEVDGGVIEAAQSMGASTMQIIMKVLLPEALPSLINGSAIAATTILGYSAMSGAVGGGGLGKLAIMYGYNRYQTDIMFITVVLLIVIVQVFQSFGNWATKRSDRRIS